MSKYVSLFIDITPTKLQNSFHLEKKNIKKSLFLTQIGRFLAQFALFYIKIPIKCITKEPHTLHQRMQSFNIYIQISISCNKHVFIISIMINNW